MSNPNPPSLSTPKNNIYVVGNVLVFDFIVPTDPDNDTLIFELELDTTSPIDSGHTNYKVYESRLSASADQGIWEVKNGSDVFITLPTTGVDSSYYGRAARVTLLQQDVPDFPDINTTWYWQVSSSDNS